MASGSRHNVSARPGGQQLAIGPVKPHAGGRHPGPQAQHLGLQVEALADAWAQVIDAQIDGAKLRHSQRDFIVPALGSAEFDVNVTADSTRARPKAPNIGR